MSALSKNFGIFGISRSPADGSRPVGYATIAAAIADASSGDLIELGPGTYAESFTIPSGVIVRGVGEELANISGVAATGTRITLSANSVLERCKITCPTDANYAVLFNGTSPNRAFVRSCEFAGAGANGFGVGNTGTGTLSIQNCAYTSGTASAFARATAGALNITNCRVDAGTLTDSVLCSGGVTSVNSYTISAVATVTDGVEVGAAFFGGVNMSLIATNGIHITSDSADVELGVIGIPRTLVTNAILVDPGVTTARVFADAVAISTAQINAPGAWLESQNITMRIQDPVLDDLAYKFWGEVNVGYAERGSELVAGEGDSYTRGMKVVTSDGTATGTTEGGNLTDVSTAAASPSGSTFTFQGVTQNHCIYVGSTLSTSDSLKHWGIKVKQTTAAVEVTPKSFIFEIWDGAAWSAIGIMATHSTLFYRYSNEVFIRSNTSEHIRYGVFDSTTWVKKTIDGENRYWVRIRIATTVTTAPVFE